MLPGLHLSLIIFTMFVSAYVPGGAYYRIFGVDPVGVGVGMVSEGAIFYATLLLCGTAWWFFVGAIGWKSAAGGLSRPFAGMGALLSVFTLVTGIALTKDVVSQDIRDGVLSLSAIVQYACVGLLCFGALIVTFYSTMAAFGRTKGV
jgi:hypothetical protein